MIELLKLCGFKAQEFESELPRVQKAFNRLGINAEDIERGKQRLIKYYDIELEGVRKALRLCLLEMVNTVLAREEGKTKVFYGFMAPGWETIGAALVTKSKDVFSAHHCWAFLLVVGCIFDKIVPIFETAENKWLKAGMVAHCSNVKATFGLVTSDLVPKPDLMITSGYLCETSPKTLDLLHELYDMPVFCYDTCLDREFSEYSQATKRIVALSAKSLRRLVDRVQEIVGFEITDDMLSEVINARKELNKAMRKLRGIIEKSDPLVLNASHETIWMCLNSLTLSMDNLPEAIDAINTLCAELQERVRQGIGVVEKGAPRILAILPSHHTDPRLEHLVAELGIAIVALDTNLFVPFKETHKDPYVRMSIGLQISLNTSLPRRLLMIMEECKKLKVDGVLDRFHVGCRSIAGDAIIFENAIKKELGIPVLLMEWENFDPRVYNHEQYKKRLEVFKTMLTRR
jgi:benzoyl-CoA reductase/2-hydroxyglutaryl-CoA dehydratase subunit BcrC/BadD/HgdB